jgi:hypothetical protein
MWQLRDELNAANAELETTKEALSSSQQTLTNTLAEARELKRQAKLALPRLHALRRYRTCPDLTRPDLT